MAAAAPKNPIEKIAAESQHVAPAVKAAVAPSWVRVHRAWLFQIHVSAAEIGFGAVVVLAGLSRIYLGEHWPSDVLGAYLLGSIWLAITVAVYRCGKTRSFVTQPVAPPVTAAGDAQSAKA